MSDDELQRENFEAAWDAGRPADVTPSRPRIVVEAEGTSRSSAHFGISMREADETVLTQVRFSPVGVRLRPSSAAVRENIAQR
jgi:hypothetical protein